MSRRPAVLMLRALGLGDFLCGVPAYRAVARRFPRHRKILAAPRALAALTPLVGGIDEVVDAQALAPLPHGVHGADVAVNLHGRGPQSHGILLRTAPRTLFAFRHDEVPESRSGPVWLPREHEVARWCRMVSWFDIEAQEDDLRLSPPTGAVARKFEGVTVIHPGAASAARRWPLERWASVARALRVQGHSLVVTGNRAEAPLAAELCAYCGLAAARSLAGRTTLLQLAAIVAGARMVLSGDTGVAHLATAYARPSVLLFGPTAPAEWGPPARPFHAVLWKGRLGNPHADRPDPGLLDIDVDEVLRAAERAQRAGPDASRPPRRGSASPSSRPMASNASN